MFDAAQFETLAEHEVAASLTQDTSRESSGTTTEEAVTLTLLHSVKAMERLKADIRGLGLTDKYGDSILKLVNNPQLVLDFHEERIQRRNEAIARVNSHPTQ